MTILVESIPLNFYCVIAVVGCLVLSLLGIDFGPMKKAEKRAAETGYLDDPKSNPDASKGDEEIQIDTDKPRMMNLLLPMLGMIAGVIAVSYTHLGGKGIKEQVQRYAHRRERHGKVSLSKRNT